MFLTKGRPWNWGRIEGEESRKLEKKIGKSIRKKSIHA